MPPKRPLKALAEELEQSGDGEDDIIVEEPALAADDPMRAFLPTSFGKQTGREKHKERLEEAKRIAPKQKAKEEKEEKKKIDDREGSKSRSESPGSTYGPAFDGGNASGSDSDSSFEASDDEDSEDEYPTSHELVIKNHTKAVTTISVDSAGARFVTGSYDCEVKFHDFHAMSANSLYAFRSVEPSASHHIHTASFCPTDKGRSLLVIPASSQAKIYSRDGEEEVEFVKGDMYLRDLNNTKGHISEITWGVWHPTESHLIATAGTDSTVRIWDINNKRSQLNVIVHKSKTAKGGRSRMCTLAWAGAVGEGSKNMIASVALDGSLLLWPGNGPYTRPAVEVRNAHVADTWTSSMAFSGDGRLLVTKGGPGDNTIKLWDTRKLKTPVNTRADFPVASQAESNLIFSPDSTKVVLGDSSGNIRFLSPATLQDEKIIKVSDSPAVTVNWVPAINQILVGTGTGAMHVLYSPHSSTNGARLVVANAPKRRHFDEDSSITTDIGTTGMSADAVILPNGILGPTSATTKRKHDPMKPAMPPITPWGKSQPDPEHIKQNIALASMRDEDPREALLKYAEKAAKDPMFTKAYQETQPKTIYAEVDLEAEEEREKEMERQKKRLKR